MFQAFVKQLIGAQFKAAIGDCLHGETREGGPITIEVDKDDPKVLNMSVTIYDVDMDDGHEIEYEIRRVN